MCLDQSLQAGKAEQIKHQIAELWIQHIEGSLDRQGCDRLCDLIDDSGLKTFVWGNAESTKYLARLKLWYQDLAQYAKSHNCYNQIKDIERLIADILFPLGLKGEAAQKEALIASASERHREAFWGFLKQYESIENAD